MKNKASFFFVMLCIVIFTISCTNDSTSSSAIDNQNQKVIDENKKAIPAVIEANPASITAPSPQNSIITGPNKLLDSSTLGIPYDLSLSIEADFIRRTAQVRCELFNDCFEPQPKLWPPLTLPSGMYTDLVMKYRELYNVDPLKIQKMMKLLLPKNIMKMIS